MRTRIHFLIQTSLYIATVFLFLACTQEKNEKPNVLLLYMDDLRPELNCYGKTQIHSPNIDALAAEGIQFNNAFCNVPVCGASRASMLTGMLPTKNRFINYNTFVSKETPSAITLPQLFKNNGYTTISNGKIYHHLDDRMDDWDEVYRPYAFDKNEENLAPTDHWQTLWKDYQLPKNKKTYIKTDKGPAYEKAEVHDSTYIDGLMTQKVIRDLKKLKSSNKPFFLTAGFISNHLPFNAPKKYWDLYPTETIKQPYNNSPQTNIPKIAIGNYGELRSYRGIPKKGPIDDQTAKELIHGYYATVSYVDALIGKITATLKSLELDKNTIVILVSDHGYLLQEHAEWAKFTNHKLSARVPLIINLPNGTTKNKTSDTFVELVDIYPTLAEICGLEIPKNQLDGKSLSPLLHGKQVEEKMPILTKKGNAFTIRTRDYSYTEYINLNNGQKITCTLFDQNLDPDENTNIAENKSSQKIVSDLSHLLHQEFKSHITGTESK